MGLTFACFQLFCRILGWASAHFNPTQNNSALPNTCSECRAGVLWCDPTHNTQLPGIYVHPATNKLRVQLVWRVIWCSKYFHHCPNIILAQFDCELQKLNVHYRHKKNRGARLQNTWIIIIWKIPAVRYAADLMAKSEWEIKYRNLKHVINAIN